ncbi:GDP-L-fucose synthase [bacterium]|nr:GDP-L-fucose synthase [bacterium]
MTDLIHPDDHFFVAGSRGMVGSAVCRSLQKKGYGTLSKGGCILAPSREDLDLLDSYSVNKWYEKHKPDVVILAAAKVGGIHANTSFPVEFLLENIKIQNNVIEAAWKTGVRRLLFLGSSCIYPKHAQQPLREESLLSGFLEPTNQWYAIAKITGIKLCESLRLQYGFDAISLMPTNLYGPGDNYHSKHSHVLPALIRRFHKAKLSRKNLVTCWGSGTPLREFLHVDDLADACTFCLEKWSIKSDSAPKDCFGEPLAFLNVGTGVDVPIEYAANKVAEILDFDGEIYWDKTKPDGTPRKLLEISRLKEIGWSSRINFNEGLASTINNYLKHFESSSQSFSRSAI